MGEWMVFVIYWPLCVISQHVLLFCLTVCVLAMCACIAVWVCVCVFPAQQRSCIMWLWQWLNTMLYFYFFYCYFLCVCIWHCVCTHGFMCVCFCYLCVWAIGIKKDLTLCQLKNKQTNSDGGSYACCIQSQRGMPFFEDYPAGFVAIKLSNCKYGAHLKSSDPILVQLYLLSVVDIIVTKQVSWENTNKGSSQTQSDTHSRAHA